MFRAVTTQMFNNLYRTLIVLTAWMIAIGAAALEADRRQQVLWSSDGGSTMRMEGAIRILELVDNVRVTQGTLEIVGDEAIFEYDGDSNELLRVTIYGSPVRYQQQLDEDGALVTGSSNSVELYREQESNDTILEFIGDARISSPDSTMHCSAIVYLAERDLIREATGPCEGTLSPSGN